MSQRSHGSAHRTSFGRRSDLRWRFGDDPFNPWGDVDPDQQWGPTHGEWAHVTIREYYSCAHEHPLTMGYLLTRNGIAQFFTVCSYCGDPQGRLMSKAAAVAWGRQHGIRTAKCFQDNQLETAPETCERCGEQTYNIHVHHWAPRHLFGWEEANKWPTSKLCQPCHTRWHQIVTPNMSRREAS